MKRKSRVLFSMVAAALLALLWTGPAHAVSAYPAPRACGYISYIEGDGQVMVERDNLRIKKVVINLPLFPGDRVITGAGGRCQLHLETGTIIRLGERSRLTIQTAGTEAYSRWKEVLTFQVNLGTLHAMVQPRRGLLQQFSTASSAVRAPHAATFILEASPAEGTRLFVKKGNVQLLYPTPNDNIRSTTVCTAVGRHVSPAREVTVDNRFDEEFSRWNESLDKDFDRLHHGPNAVPREISKKKYPPAVVYFARHWSTLYGEWRKDPLLGWVWKSYDVPSNPALHPFHDGKYHWRGGQLYLVPRQRWAWAPAHLGAWVWLTGDGWVWAPGKTFSPGVIHTPGPAKPIHPAYALLDAAPFSRLGTLVSRYECMMNAAAPATLGNWISLLYGDMKHYFAHRRGGTGARPKALGNSLGAVPVPVPPGAAGKVPAGVRALIRKLDRAPLRLVEERLGRTVPAAIRFLPGDIIPALYIQSPFSGREQSFFQRLPVEKIQPAVRARIINSGSPFAVNVLDASSDMPRAFRGRVPAKTVKPGTPRIRFSGVKRRPPRPSGPARGKGKPRVR